MRNVLHLILLCLCLTTVALSQEQEVANSDSSHQETSNIETPGNASDSLTEASTVTSKSPLGAVTRSALLPGLGQYYNEAYWKVPIVLGITGFLVYGIIHEHSSFTVYRDRYDASIATDAPSGDLRLKVYREFYRDRRDSYAWWLLIAYLFQIADAYVDAHLFGFDVGDVNLLVFSPSQLPTRISIQLRF